ncbi:MAG TPA: FAD-dependent oxidoreductase, partial [Longimicrobiales bacterium]|nr:FAD-dependent oxidoreductase [Longimicrobiales bacterium]
MKRRTFLRRAGAAAGAAALGGVVPDGARGDAATPDPAARRSGPRVIPRRAPDVAVVGAGAFGAWTALHLRERGASVALVDAYGPGNYRATSGGDSRQIRAGYGSREVYTEWALEALRRWSAREEEWGEELMVTCGRLSIAPAPTAGMRAEKEVLDRHGVENELLT